LPPARGPSKHVKTRQNTSEHVKTRQAVRTRQTVPQLRARSAREGQGDGPGLGVCREALGVKLVLVPAQPGARVVKGGQRWSNGEVTRGRARGIFARGTPSTTKPREFTLSRPPPLLIRRPNGGKTAKSWEEPKSGAPGEVCVREIERALRVEAVASRAADVLVVLLKGLASIQLGAQRLVRLGEVGQNDRGQSGARS